MMGDYVQPEEYDVLMAFHRPLLEKIGSREKRTTWRLAGEYDLLPGDKFLAVPAQGEQNVYVPCEVKWVKTTNAVNMTAEDLAFHENYGGPKRRVDELSKVMGQDIRVDDPLDVIRFDKI